MLYFPTLLYINLLLKSFKQQQIFKSMRLLSSWYISFHYVHIKFSNKNLIRKNLAKLHTSSPQDSRFPNFQRSSPKALDFQIFKFPKVQPQGSRCPNFQISSPKALDFQLFPDFQPQGSRCPNFQISSSKALDFQVSKFPDFQISRFPNGLGLNFYAHDFLFSCCLRLHPVVDMFVFLCPRVFLSRVRFLLLCHRCLF